MFRQWGMRYAIAAVALVLAACGQSDPASTPGPSSTRAAEPLRGTFTTAENTAQGTTISLQFTEDSRLVANAGCNTISGPITLSGNQIDTANLSITEIACDPTRHEQDQRLSAFLGSKPTFTLNGETLTLNGAGTTMSLMRTRAAQLTGVVWIADTLIQGSVAGATPAGVTASLVFGPDEVTVIGLCNLDKIPYRTSGSKITFTLEAVTLKMCAPEVMAIERAMKELANSEATYRIDNSTLTITKGDRGLRFTAAK
jgi:heat shock protein HslJ